SVVFAASSSATACSSSWPNFSQSSVDAGVNASVLPRLKRRLQPVGTTQPTNSAARMRAQPTFMTELTRWRGNPVRQTHKLSTQPSQTSDLYRGAPGAVLTTRQEPSSLGARGAAVKNQDPSSEMRAPSLFRP